MAFSNVVNHGITSDSVSGASIAHTLNATGNITAGKWAAFWVVTDNVDAGENTNEHTGVTDSQGNTWNKVVEIAYGGTVTGPDNACTVSLWQSLITTTLVASVDTVTAALSGSQTAKKAGLISFDVEGTPTFADYGFQTGGAASGSVALPTLTSREYLVLALLGAEGAIDNYVQDDDYNAIHANNGSDTTTVAGRAAYRIATLTDDTYAVSWQNSRDFVLILAAFWDDVAATDLIDNFDDNSLDAAKWASHTDGGDTTVAETNQRIVITPSTTQTGLQAASIKSVDPWDITGKRYFVQIPKLIAGSRTVQQIIFTPDVGFTGDINGADTYVAFWFENSVVFVRRDDGVTSGVLTSFAYNATTMRYFAIREAGGTTFWETSPDGVNWTVRHSLTNPVAVTALYIELRALKYGSASPSATTAEFDGFNTTGDVILLDLPVATLTGVAQSITPNTPAGILVNLPVASINSDPGVSLGALHDLRTASATFAAKAMQALLGGAIFVDVPIAALTITANEFTTGLTLEVDLPLAELFSEAQALNAPIQVTLPTATFTSRARPFNDRAGDHRRRVFVLYLLGKL